MRTERLGSAKEIYLMLRDRAPLLGRHASAHFVGLDGLRGVAAFVVAYLHADLTFQLGYQPGTASLAVDFFFMLSGFVLAYAYDRRLQHGMTWLDFMRVRLIRLYPMLFCGSVLGAIAFLVAQHQRHQYGSLTSAWMIAGSFLVLPVGLPVDDYFAYPLNIAYWSLFFEFIANAVYATGWGRLSPRRLGLTVLVFALATGVMTFASRPYIQIGVTSPHKFLWGFVRVAYPFAAGLLLYQLRHRWAQISHWKVFTGSGWWWSAAIMAGALVLPIDSPWCDLALSFAVFPLLIHRTASLNLSPATARVCAVLGRLSYPVYILHWPIYRFLHGATQMLRLDIAPWLQALAGAVAVILLSQVTLTMWDEPVRRWLSRWPTPSAA
jgi:peptidoglycan/LPS O-acetylase OafA/YrhL